MPKQAWAAVALAAWLAILGATSSCSDSKPASAQGTFSVSLAWPPGFSFDQSSWTVYPPSGPRYSIAPAYVTSATLTLTSVLTGEKYVFPIPLDTGLVTGSAPPGEYIVSIMVETSIGLIFTGQANVSLYPGYNPDVAITLAINAPPSISSLTASKYNPRPEEVISLQAQASDADDDPLTYTWTAGAGFVNGQGSTATWVSSTAAETAITVTVADGRGGLATASVKVNAVNQAPVISTVTSSVMAPLFGAVVTLNCAAADPDGDAVTYSWSTSQDSWTATGPTASYTVSTPAQTAVTCKAADSFGAFSTASVVLNQGSNGIPGAPQSVTASGGVKQVAVSWGAVANATSYNLYWGLASGSTPNKIPLAAAGYTHTGLADGTAYYYKVTAVTVAGEGPASLEVNAPTIPATPATLTATASSGAVALAWTASTGATGYNIQWGNTAAMGSVISGVAGPTYNHAVTDWQWHYYKVTAVNASGQSAPSVQVSVYPNPGVLGAVSGLAMTAATDSGVSANDAYTYFASPTFSWTGPAGAESYNVYNEFGTLLGTVASATFTVGGQADGTHSISVTPTNTTVGLTGTATALSYTVDTAPPSYTGVNPSVILCLSSLLTQNFAISYSEAVWFSSVAVTTGNASASYAGGNGTSTITVGVLNNPLNFANVTVQIIVKDKAGNGHTLNLTIGPNCG